MRFIETKNGRVALWVVQALLALLYLFAGGMKLLTPLDTLAVQSHMPGLFIKLIGVCEVAGALGLVLPELLGIARILTPLAAVGLCVIMVGAVSVTVTNMGVAPAAVPFVAGLMAAFVAYGRWPEGRGRFWHRHVTS